MTPDFAALVRGRHPDLPAETADELAQHLEDLYDEAIDHGRTPEDALAAAWRAVDDPAVASGIAAARLERRYVTDGGRSPDPPSSSGGSVLIDLSRDVRYAWRLLRRQPGFSAVTIVTLTLGLGVNIAVFSVMQAALLASLPIPAPERLVQIYSWTPAYGDHFDFSYPLYVDGRDRGHEMAAVAAYTTGVVGVATGDRRERVISEFTTSNYFAVLGVSPALGPGFSGRDERRGAALVAVVSDRLWRTMLDGAPDAIGRTMSVDGQSCAIVGVAPAAFTGIVTGQRADIWLTINQYFPLRHRPDSLDRRTTSWMSLLARLNDGVSREQFEARMTAALRAEGSEGDPAWAVRVRSAGRGDGMLVSGLDRPLRLLSLVVALVLIIAAANVANLLLARSYARRPELAIRQSLGAGVGRLARQLLIEAALLAAFGAAGAVAAGLAVAKWFDIRTVEGAAALDLSIRPNAGVMLFGAALAAMAALAIGLAPAVMASRLSPVEVARGVVEGRMTSGRGRLRAALTVVQVALSVVLVIGAGLFLRTLANLRSIDPAMLTTRTVAATINLTLRGYDEARGRQFYTRLLERVRAVPGVDATALAFVLPVTPGGMRENLNARATDPPIDVPVEFDVVPISSGLFQTVGIPLVLGRDFGPAETETSPRAAIVNERMQRRFWPSGNAVGSTFRAGEDRYTVVGIARDSKYRNLREEPRMTMYVPMTQAYEPALNLVVRTALPVEQVVPGLRSALRDVDAGMPLYNVRTLAEHVERSLYFDRLRARLLSVLALLALVLSAVGIYGVVSYTVAQRTREVGIRLALGAEPAAIVRMLLAGGARLALAGVAIGMGVAAALARAIRAQLFGVTPADPVTLVAAAAILIAVALVATLVPARRATRIDPMQAVRAE